MDRKKAESLARDLTQYIDGKSEEFTDWVKKNDKRITNAIMRVVSEMPAAQDGYVDKTAITKFNSSLSRKLKKALEAIGYYARAESLVADFDQISTLNATLHKFVNDISSETLLQLASPVKQKVAAYTLSNLTQQGYDAVFTTPLKNQIARLATIGTTLTDTVNSIRDFVEGTGENSLFSRYAIAAGRDALGQYDGALNQKIADEYGLDAFFYVGSVIETTRHQCERWLAMDIILKKDLQNEIDWAFDNGSGMIAGTTPATFVVFRGGYGCRHKAVPTRSQNIDNDDD